MGALIPMVPIAARPHPLKSERIGAMAPAWTDLSSALWASGLPTALLAYGGTTVWVNDVAIARERWGLYVLRPGDIVAVTVTAQGGGGDKVLRTVMMLGILGLSMFIPPLIGITGPSGALLGAGMMFGGSLLVNALVPPQQPNLSNSGKRDAPTYAITGMRNQADPYGPVTRIYGLHRVYPKYAALPYTELVGDDQYLRCLFLIGKGKYRLTEHKIGETAVGDYDDLKIESYYTGETNTFTLFPQSVNEEALSVELTEAASWQTRSTVADTDEISIDLTFPLGIFYVHSDGDRSSSEATFQIAYAPYGTTDWISYSETQGLTFEGSPSPSIAVGQAISGVTSGATGTIRRVWKKTEYQDTGSDDEWGNDIYDYVTYTYQVRVELTDPEVLFVDGETVSIAGGTYSAVIDNARSGAITVIRNQTSQLRYGITIDVPTGQWTVRIRRTNPTNENHVNQSYWTAIRSIKHGAPVTAENVTLVALRIKATGQLNGTVDQYNCMARALVESYNGSTWDLANSRSPAWAFADVLVGESNARPLAASKINLTALRTWADNCSSAGRTFDAVIDYRTTVWDMLKVISAVGRASPGINDGLITVIEDQTHSTPVQHFSPRNTWGFSGQKAFAELPHALKVRFVNADTDYVMDERVVYDDGYTSANATKFEALDLHGATAPAQVWKWGRYMIACGRLRPEVYQFNCDIENIVCTRGDMVRLTHDVLSVGLGQGRIKSLTTSGSNIATITVDDVFPMETGSSYGIRIRKSTGATATATVATVNGDNTVLTLTSTLASSGIAAGDLVLYGQASAESIETVVSRIEPGPELTARVSCVPYNAAILTADSGDIPAWTSNITLPPARNRTPTQPLIRSTHYDFHATRLNDDGSKAIVMTVTWDLMSTSSTFSRILGAIVGSVVDTSIAGFEVQYRIEDDDWVSLTNRPASARRVNIIVQEDYTYAFRIRSYNASGMTSAWDTETGVAVDLVHTVPTPPTSLQVKNGGTAWSTRACQIEWTAPSSEGPYGVRIRDYKVMVYDGSDNLRRTRYVTDTKYSYTYSANCVDGSGTPVATVKFRVYTRDIWGDLSATYASLTAVNAAPAAPANITAYNNINTVEFAWDPNTERDFSHFTFRLKAGSGSWRAWRNTTKSGVTKTLTSAEIADDMTIYIEVKAVDYLGNESSVTDTSADSDRLNDEVEASNVLRNPSFELARSNTARARNWEVGVVVREATGGNASNAYGKVTRAGSDVTTYQLNNDGTTSRYIPVLGGETYEWGGDIKVELGTITGRLGLYELDKDLAAVESTASSSTDTSWASVRKVTTLQQSTRYVRFALRVLNADGYACFDNLFMRRIGPIAIAWAVSETNENFDGSNVDVQTSLAIGSATYEADGFQVEYNSGNPRFYCGDGSDNYVKFNGTNVIISSSVANALVIKSGGNIKIEAGGDLVMDNVTGSTQGNRSRIKFNAVSSDYTVIEGDYDNHRVVIHPSTDTEGELMIGYGFASGMQRFGNVYILANNYAILKSIYGSGAQDREGRFTAQGGSTYGTAIMAAYYQATEGGEDNASVTCYSSDDANYIDFVVQDDGNTYAVRIGGNLRPLTDSQMPLGTASYCWTNVYADAGVTSCSDRKYKTDIEPLSIGLDLIRALVPVSFRWNRKGERPKNHDGKYFGLIAPEVEQALAEVGCTEAVGAVEVTTDDNNQPWYGLKYEQFIAPIIRALQELDAEVRALKGGKACPTK